MKYGSIGSHFTADGSNEDGRPEQHQRRQHLQLDDR
jgi:hypothetical protein